MSEEVPAICEKCLGDNPYLRMTREKAGEKCHMCQRPYTTFRWVPRKREPYKKTTVCSGCSKIKNCCQCCMLDLTYGLSIAIRDQALKMASNKTAIEGSTDRTRLYAVQQQELDYEREEFTDEAERARDLLKRLAEAKDLPAPRNSTKRHKKQDEAEDDEPVHAEVEKTASKLPFNGTMSAPDDQNVASFFVWGVDEELTESSIKRFFTEQSRGGNLKAVQIVHAARCGFITYADRSAAEILAKRIPEGRIVIDGCKMKIAWGKPRPLGTNMTEHQQLARLVKRAMKGNVKKKIPKKKAAGDAESKSAKALEASVQAKVVQKVVDNAEKDADEEEDFEL